MKKIRLRNVILIAVTFIIAFLLGLNMYMRTTLLSVYDVDKAYMYEPPEADITILAFNQYSCDVCRDTHPSLQAALIQDGKVRYIPRPIGCEESWDNTLVQAVYAAALQGKFIQMHNAIYDNWPVEDRNTLFSVAEQQGLDVQQLQRDMESEDIRQRIKENKDYLTSWGLQSTPAYLINKKILFIPDKEKIPTIDIWLEKFKRARARN